MSLKVLLADDSMTAQNMGKKILTDAGFQVIAVSNGAQALKKLASEKPDLVVLDVYMPGYSGLEVCERIKSAPDTARIPVVLCVAKMEPFKPEEGTRVRADAVIVKPFEATDLVSRVQELGQKVQPRPRQQKVEAASAAEVETADFVEPTQPPATHVDVPRELAVEPAVGMELMTEETTQDAETAAPGASRFPATFEIEHERQPVEGTRDVRMQAADGLSGVFEMSQSQPAQENAVPEFDVFSQPAAAEQSSPSADDIRGQAAAAAQVEPRPEFVVDRVSISIPLSHTDAPDTSNMPSAPADAASEPLVVNDAASLEPAQTSPQPEQPQSTGYTGIYEFESPKGGLDTPMVATRVGHMRGSTADSGKPITSVPQTYSGETYDIATVAIETAELTESAAPAAVWIAEEVALEPGEAEVSLEEEMRAALAPAATTPSEQVEVPLGAAAEKIAAFTTQQPAEAKGEPEDLGEQAKTEERDNFESMSDDIVSESNTAQPWYAAPEASASMPDPSAMDSVAALQQPVPEFSSESTVAPDFSIPGHAFGAVPADDFGPEMSTVIDAESCERPAPETAQDVSQFQPASMLDEPMGLGTTAGDGQHPLGAMAQAIAKSPALSSVKREDAEPMVEAIVTRMLQQIKPELIAHVLRELEKK